MNAAQFRSNDDTRRVTLQTLSEANPSVPHGKGGSEHDKILLHTFHHAEACRRFFSRTKAAGIKPDFRFVSRRLQVFVTRRDSSRSFELLEKSLDRDPDIRSKGFRRANDIYIAKLILVLLGLFVIILIGRWRIAVGFSVTYAACITVALRMIRHILWFGTSQFRLVHLLGITALSAVIVSIWIWAL